MSIACYREGCGASVCFTPEVERRLRRTHESWMCPFGHRQHFVAETNEEIEIRHLKVARNRYRDFWHETQELFGTCPLQCGYRSRSGIERRWYWVLRHLSEKHPMEGRRLFLSFVAKREEARREAS